MPRIIACLPLLLLLLGCGSPSRPYTDNSKDADLYAKDVKEIALNAVQKARRSREPADQLRTLVTELEQQKANRRPIGAHQALYSELLAAAKPLMEDCEKANGKPANLAARLDALKTIAEKLPGKVQTDKE